MQKLGFLMVCCSLLWTGANAQTVIKVAATSGDATKELQAAIGQAAKLNGKPVVIELQNADYKISREKSSKVLYHISNTASETENPDQTKHIALWFKNLRNITLDGNGARLVTHGEITTFAIDKCENITLRNFTLTANDPTVPELTVTEIGNNYMTVKIHPQSKYTIDKNGKFSFHGHNWQLDGGISQTYDPQRDITWRGWSPLDGLKRSVELEPNLIRMTYDRQPDAQLGHTFQMRDAIRDQACGLIQQSKNIVIENAHFAFLGNFGIVGQASENITYRNLKFVAEAESGRTCSGFADFVQMSGCKGMLKIENSYFSGAHDDPINIHGTHLKVISFPAPNQVLVRYMHHQTYGFQSFFAGDRIEFTHPNTLMCTATAQVKKAEMRSEREILITLNKALPAAIIDNNNLVVENVTYTPNVEIINNYFSRIPTRGILVTTRGRVNIANNTFFRMQMSAILIANDARSWYESGAVKNVTISRNNFIECGTPVINISPENNENGGFVHSNITITGNRFVLGGTTDAISAKSVDGLQITENYFKTNNPMKVENLIRMNDCQGVVIQNNYMGK